MNRFRDTGYWVGHSSANWKQATLVRVKTIIEHEKYDPKSKSKTNENDIALMKLERPIAFRKGLVTPICLTDKPLDRKLKAEIAGWGKLNSKSKEASDKLMQVKLNQHSDSECSNVKYFSPNKMICAGYLEGGQDACQVKICLWRV